MHLPRYNKTQVTKNPLKQIQKSHMSWAREKPLTCMREPGRTYPATGKNHQLSSLHCTTTILRQGEKQAKSYRESGKIIEKSGLWVWGRYVRGSGGHFWLQFSTTAFFQNETQPSKTNLNRIRFSQFWYYKPLKNKVLCVLLGENELGWGKDSVWGSVGCWGQNKLLKY